MTYIDLIEEPDSTCWDCAEIVNHSRDNLKIGLDNDDVICNHCNAKCGVRVSLEMCFNSEQDLIEKEYVTMYEK